MLDSLVRDTAKVLTGKTKETKPYDTTAEVVRIEGNTAWVHISGGVSETPVDMTINAKTGDQVNIRVSGGKAWITGNGSAPPTDDTKANVAQTTATEAKTVADSAQADASRASVAADSAEASARSAQQSATEASEAAAIADGKANEAKASAQNANEYASRALGNLSTVQSVAETLAWITQHGTMTLTSDVSLDPTHVYFVRDANGDYTVGSYKYSVVVDPDVDDISTYYELTIDESLNNYVGTHLALTNEGLWLLPATSGTNKVLIATGAGSTYTTAGTYILNSSGGVEASFRSNGATIGEVLNGRTRTEIGTSGMQIIQRDGGSDTQIANLGYGEGAISTGTADAPFYSFGSRKTGTIAYNSSSTYSIGDICVYSGKTYVCIADITTAEAWTSSHWRLLIGANSFTQGGSNIASGYNSHAQGMGAFSLGHNSHAEGSQQPGPEYTIAVGEASHAEGMATKSVGRASHAEGSGSKATGNASHAQNVRTIAASTGQTAVGKYNVSDSADTYAVIVGNGTADNARSNALTVDWSGNVNIASGAKYKINGTALSASDVSAVPTSRTVNNKALSSDITLSASDVSAVPSSDVTTSGASGKIPRIGDNNVLEGPYRIDFHNNGGTVVDYDTRIATTGNGTKGQGTMTITAGSLKWGDDTILTQTGLFKVVSLTITTTAQVSAHSYIAGATYTVPAADRPSGMVLVGVVGTATSNFRLYCSTIYVNGDHSIYATIANSSATAVASGATVTPRLLYMRATSA